MVTGQLWSLLQTRKTNNNFVSLSFANKLTIFFRDKNEIPDLENPAEPGPHRRLGGALWAQLPDLSGHQLHAAAVL